MNKTLLIVLVILSVVVIGVITVGATFMGVYNSQVNLRAAYNTSEQMKETVYDNMWKSIAQTGEVTAHQQQLIEDVITNYAKARGTNGGGGMINAVSENIPSNFATELSVNQQNIILSARDQWVRLNQEAVTKSVIFNARLQGLPWGPVLGMFFQPLTPQTISSTRTKGALKSGIDDDTSVFPSKK